MRPMLLPLLAATLIGSPVCAERLVSPAPVRAVTLYPDGATVTRSLRIDGAPGVHELVVTDLPPGIDAASLRVGATGARIGTVSLQRDRALPGEDMESDAVKAAREELQRLEAALRDRDARVAAIRARAQAAEATVAFLRALPDLTSERYADLALGGEAARKPREAGGETHAPGGLRPEVDGNHDVGKGHDHLRNAGLTGPLRPPCPRRSAAALIQRKRLTGRNLECRG